MPRLLMAFRRLISGLAWPLPALLVWSSAWLLFGVSAAAGLPVWAAFLVGTTLGLACSCIGRSRWRRAFIAGGFPLSLLASGLAAGLPAAAWLLPLALLALIYPLGAWQDAPLFPTPQGALAGLADAAPLPPGARVLDAGCGLGDGLRELRHAYPQAELHGLEWSWPLRLLCGLLCPWARVRRGNIWQQDWSAYQMVYLFQRPESMPQALAKAEAEMAAGSWLVSLEFAVAGAEPTAALPGAAGRAVWAYRIERRADGAVLLPGELECEQHRTRTPVRAIGVPGPREYSRQLRARR